MGDVGDRRGGENWDSSISQNRTIGKVSINMLRTYSY